MLGFSRITPQQLDAAVAAKQNKSPKLDVIAEAPAPPTQAGIDFLLATSASEQLAAIGGAAASHDHDERYYTQAQVDSAIAGVGGGVADWDDITNKPSTFPPSAHNHDSSYYTETEVDTALAGKVDTNDSRLSDARAPTAHNHNASDINAGTVATARLGSGTPDGTTFLRGDQTWATPSGGSDPFTTARVTGSNATTTGQSLVNITGLSVALLANSVYAFEAVLGVQSSSTAGNGYGVQFSAAGASVEAQATGTLAAATQKTVRVNALNTAATPFVTVAATGGMLIKGIIQTGANAGNLTIQHLKVTSGTSTVFINSYLEVRKLA